MRKIEDSLDFLIFENKHLKNKFNSGNLKNALHLYLNDIDSFLSNADNDEKLINYLKDNVIIKKIPDSYMEYSKGYIIDLGYYDENSRTYRTELTDEQYAKVLGCIQDEQITSLNPWIGFLCNKERNYPIWFRFYLFSKVLKIGTTYNMIEAMSKRSKTTTDPFIKCDYDIIDNLYNELNKIIEEGKTTDELSGFSFQTEYFKAMKKTGNYGRSIRV